MRRPEFVVVGAMKAGTTALYQYLLQHRDVFLSPRVKESRFLSGLNPVSDPDICQQIPVVSRLSEYETLFEAAGKDQVVGEVDPWCLHLYQRAIPRIKEYLSSNTKIIMMLRNPVDRCYSNYYQFVRLGWPIAEFEQILDASDSDRRWYEALSLEAGLYSSPVAAYLKSFQAKNVLIILHEDFLEKPVDILRNVCLHIGVSEKVGFDLSYRANLGGTPRSRLAYNLVLHRSIVTETLKRFVPLALRRKWKYRLINMIIKRYPALGRNARERLIDYYYSDIRNLEKLLDRDFSKWLA